MQLPILFQRAEGLAILIASIYFYFRQKGSVWMFLALILVPDICMVGYVWGNRAGAIIYNLGHNMVFPILIVGIGIVMFNNICILLALIWMAHIGMDRLMGYGLKSTEGFTHTHLGDIKRSNKNQ